ncbi:MAG: hypothetical protein CBB71_18445 [Rhodopirellula sp. TMED11]|nr:MAG: hypothetical protein CBB71_18445 [Rhodopirellula sp. TMED11]
MLHTNVKMNPIRWVTPWILLTWAVFPSCVIGDETNAPTAEGIEFFETRIRPVLVEHCDQCHSLQAKNIQGGLKLDSKAAAQQGGDSGPAIVPGNVDESLLIDALNYDGFEMPPKGKLPDPVIEDFKKWIEMGAPDPRDDTSVPETAIDFDEAGKFWSFQPVQRAALPSVKRKDWPTSKIDYFTLSKLEQLGLSPVGPASKRVLIRRATFDLIGLPPTPQEVEEFVNDDSPLAFEALVDRLLDSEHYGERWGRYWLDVARYAEDQAHTFSVRANTNGYRYRDWVIRAFNSDLPYNEFVRLQVAGDLVGPRAQGNHDHLIALGFFGLGAQYYKNSDKAKAMADELDDRVDTLTRGFLGLTVSCARCHDHKFDPIPTQDYYSLAGIFNSSKLHNAPLCSQEEIANYNEGQKVIKQAEEDVKKFFAEAKVAEAETRVDQIADYMVAAWRVRLAQADGNNNAKKEIAESSSLNEYLLNRWVGFLDPKQKGKVSALDPWYDFTLDPAKEKDAKSLDQVKDLAKQFQDLVDLEIRLRDGLVDRNSSGQGLPHTPGSPRFITRTVTKARPTAKIAADIRGAKELYLVVNDGGNGKSCDHADWISPKLIGEKGELKLSELKWKRHEGGQPRVNTNHSGQPIRVGGKAYPEGIGVHAESTIVFDVPEGYDRFEAVGGLDNSGSDQGGCGEQASVQFCIYTEKPTRQPLLNLVLGKDGPLAVPDKELEKFLEGPAKEQLVALKAAVETAKSSAPSMYPIAHAYTESRPADMKVFVRGNPARQREVAPRRFLRILAGEQRSSYTSGSGRLELANAIASPDNPLTARVMVNRIWQHHFGRGIVGTPSNFGNLGEAPTHPALLDYLASRFIENGWSVKQLHREIMLSATYRLAADSNATNREVDAGNRFLWRANRRRLDVEAWRDSVLDVSGQLDRTMEGPSTKLSDANNVRRTVYAKISRHELDSLLRLFDFPDANITSSKRTETTVPQQQLFVLNSPFMINRAKAFAERLHTEAPADDSSRIERAFQLAYGRSPSQPELQLGLDYLAGEKAAEDKLTRWQSYAQVLLGSNELMYVD